MTANLMLSITTTGDKSEGKVEKLGKCFDCESVGMTKNKTWSICLCH